MNWDGKVYNTDLSNDEVLQDKHLTQLSGKKSPSYLATLCLEGSRPIPVFAKDFSGRFGGVPETLHQRWVDEVRTLLGVEKIGTCCLVTSDGVWLLMKNLAASESYYQEEQDESGGESERLTYKLIKSATAKDSSEFIDMFKAGIPNVGAYLKQYGERKFSGEMLREYIRLVLIRYVTETKDTNNRNILVRTRDSRVFSIDETNPKPREKVDREGNWNGNTHKLFSQVVSGEVHALIQKHIRDHSEEWVEELNRWKEAATEVQELKERLAGDEEEGSGSKGKGVRSREVETRFKARVEELIRGVGKFAKKLETK